MNAVVGFQETTGTDATNYTSSSRTPVSGALYLLFTFGRTGDVAHRIPTCTGTNGWNTTWSRITGAQSIYTFTGTDRGGIEAFWGVASSSSAGTITNDYGAGTILRAHTWHMIQITGTPAAFPIGATASANSGGGFSGGRSAQLTSMPARNSLVVVCGAGDWNQAPQEITAAGASSAIAKAIPGYTLLGAAMVPGATGVSHISYNAAPLHKTVGAFWQVTNVDDINAVSAVEIRDATADPVEFREKLITPTPLQRIGA